MIRRLLVVAVASGTVLGAVGCRHRCCSSAAPRPYYPNPPSGSVIGPPVRGGTNIPPADVPVTPAPLAPGVGPSVGPAVPAPAPSGSLPPPADPLFGTSPSPPREGNFRPAPPPANNGRPSQEILLPDPLPGSGSSSKSPSPARDGVLGAPVAPPGQTAEPPVSKGNAGANTTAPAAALPGFVRVKDGVASGRKPTLDGFDALKRAGYKTVLFLHAPGADVAATRDVAQNKGLSFAAVEVTPEKLPEALDEFNRVVGDRRAQPVYVVDDTGVRAGALWYLHFRTVELQNDDAAKIKARALGMTDTGPEATEFQLAVQRYLENR